MQHQPFSLLMAAFVLSLAGRVSSEERTQTFDSEPGWHAHNNRPAPSHARTIEQDFGFSATAHATGRPGEIGGLITPAAEPAWYGKRIGRRTMNEPLFASGSLAAEDGSFHLLIAFFNSKTVNEWRTPNTVAIRLNGRGDHFFAYVEYCTQKWRAGADSPTPFPSKQDPQTGRSSLIGFPSGGMVRKWSLRYDPAGNSGHGVVIATIDDKTAICHLDPGHKADGAVFSHFGMLNVTKSADSPGRIWLDDLTILDDREAFDSDPKWEGFDNRRTYTTLDIRPHFDFGFSPTHFAGGRKSGELGGLIFRGDGREASKIAFYADRLPALTPGKPLKASGKIAFRRGVSDSTTLLGFFHSLESTAVDPSQDAGIPKNFIGLAVEGPSREGFLVYPVARGQHDQRYSSSDNRPHLLPDGRSHDWTLLYAPAAAPDAKGRLTISLDAESVSMELSADDLKGARFDRFGLLTTRIDGNGQRIYFDDLAYTASQD